MASDVAGRFGEKLRPARPGSGRHETSKSTDEKVQEKTNERKVYAMSKMTLVTEGDKYVVVTRHFAAPPEAVYRAHTEPQLIQKWLLGPDGWTMPVCISEARPNGKIRYEWSNGNGGGFHLTGEYLE